MILGVILILAAVGAFLHDKMEKSYKGSEVYRDKTEFRKLEILAEQRRAQEGGLEYEFNKLVNDSVERGECRSKAEATVGQYLAHKYRKDEAHEG